MSSPPTGTSSPSILSDVTKRASHLWRTGSRKHKPSISGGKHTVLSSTDNLDSVPLEDINASPPYTPSPSPTPSSSTSLRRNSGDQEAAPDPAKKINRSSSSENPFENPVTPTALEAVSPFADTHKINTGGDPQTPIQGPNSRVSQKRYSRLQPPPPLPLDLPRPKTPPVVTLPTQPQPRSAPDATRSGGDEDGSDGKPVRWWHEWLCGCGEGPDRGGDTQVHTLSVYFFSLGTISQEHCILTNRLVAQIPSNELQTCGLVLPLYALLFTFFHWPHHFLVFLYGTLSCSL